MRLRRPSPRPWHAPRRPAALVAAVVLTLTAQGAAAAAAQADPAAASAKSSAKSSFASSFESDDPQVDWRNTVETGPDGEKKASGVDGGYSNGIPGNVTDKVT
ncbi:hypothetical protein AB4Z54_73720, partial [Streptomyces sp. MCAF7]